VEELDKESGDKRLHAAMGIAGVFQTLLLGALEDAGW
jgi:hypothetical protein